MSWLSSMTPINLQEEKEKFLRDTSYNPQFIFADDAEEIDLGKYGQPIQAHIELAQEILEKAYYGRNYRDLLMMDGKVIESDEVEEKIHTFLKMHHLEHRYSIVWSSSFVSRATIDASTIKLRTNSEFRYENLLGMIYHEIGTHALRRENYEQQPWYKKRKKFGLNHLYLPTEEGLASLHVALPKTFMMLHTIALRYLAVHYAQTHSFAELWKFLAKYIQDDIETQWMICFRQKRGLRDTSQPGGYTKDLVYFQGAVEVWQWLAKNDFNPTKLYIGKIGWQDVDKAIEMNPEFEPLLPSFYTLEPEKYAKKLQEIGTVNQFDKL